MAYKNDVNDARESPAIDVAQLLLRAGAKVSYSDPFVPSLDHGDVKLEAIPVDRALADGIDCAVITTNHKAFDYERSSRARAARRGHAQRIEGYACREYLQALDQLCSAAL